MGGSVNGSGGADTAAAKVVAEIVELGGEAIADHCDITDVDAVAAMVATAVDKWGRVDILINNAGILQRQVVHQGPSSTTSAKSSTCI